jgi:hypothetical protein
LTRIRPGDADNRGGSTRPHHLKESIIMDTQTHIRRLNDMTRTQPEIVHATWVTTRGVLHLLAGDNDRDDAVLPAPARVAALRAAIATFSNWSEDNDPYSEHDFGAFDLFDQRLFFKIDLYEDTSVKSKNDPSSVKRVLTVMLAEEY